MLGANETVTTCLSANIGGGVKSIKLQKIKVKNSWIKKVVVGPTFESGGVCGGLNIGVSWEDHGGGGFLIIDEK